MTDEIVMGLIREAYEKNFTELNLSSIELTQLPSEIGKLTNLTKLDLSQNQLTQLPSEIGKLTNLIKLNLYGNQLTQFPPEITDLTNLIELNISINQLIEIPPEIAKLTKLTKLDLYRNYLDQLPLDIEKLIGLRELDISLNQLTQIPPEISKLTRLTKLDLSQNQLTQLPSEIGKLTNLIKLNLYGNQLTQFPPEITDLTNLIELNISINQLTEIPPEIARLTKLTTLVLFGSQLAQLPLEITKLTSLKALGLFNNHLTQIPPEIAKLTNLSILDLSRNQLTWLPPEIKDLKKLRKLILSNNELTKLPPEIVELTNLNILDLSYNELTQLPSEIVELTNLTELDLSGNLSLTSPPPEIASMGLEAILTYIKQSKNTENNEAKLILVGNGKVGKTCLAYRLVKNKFIEDEVTQGINISKWITSAPDSENSEIRLNIWDFGGQEIYHATHQFFLTRRSVYLLVWNARQTRDYDHIYYWLHIIEALGEGSPIILVMSKMNECDDDLNLKELKSKFNIQDYVKVDSKDGRGISSLKETILRTAWDLPMMRVKWVDSWYKVRQKLENLGESWITYDRFLRICESEGLDNENISILDDYLNDLGVTLHFKDRIALKDIVILKPEWATGAFYKILSTKSVLYREGILLYSELDQIWDKETYPLSVYIQLLELMNKFELAYELPDKNSYLIPELLPRSSPSFDWDNKDNLYFYYCYDSFLPSGIITRFIVRMHENIEKKENGMPLCWREGAVLKIQNSSALIEMKPDEKQIEIRLKGDNKRGALEIICFHLDHINASIKKIKVNKQVPCNCSESCHQKYSYEKLLMAEIKNEGTIQCHETYEHVPISLLLDGYKKKEDRFKEYEELSSSRQIFVISPIAQAYSEANPLTNIKQKTRAKQKTGVKQKTKVNIDLKIDLPQIQTEFDNLRREIKNLDPELKYEMDEIQDSLDEVSADDSKEKLKRSFNRLRRFLIKLGDPKSDYNEIIVGTRKGTELVQKIVETFNKVAPLLGILSLHGIL